MSGLQRRIPLQRGGTLRRTKSLAPGKGLARRVPLARVQAIQRAPREGKPPAPRKSPSYTGPDAATVAALAVRDGGVCVTCGEPGSTWDPLVPHHRKNRGMGGSSDPAVNRLTNLLLVHHTCNGALESVTRREFYDNGWKLRALSAASTTPVLYPDGTWRLLDDAGGCRTVPAPADHQGGNSVP